jgi:hypothetical protein
MPSPATNLSAADKKIINVAARDAIKTQRSAGMFGLRDKSEQLIRKYCKTGARSHLLCFIATNRYGIDLDESMVEKEHFPPNAYFQWHAFIQRLIPLLESPRLHQ